MYNQVGSPKFDEYGNIVKGLMIRHLALPNNIENSKNVLKWIKENIDEDVYINIMAQYFPAYKAKKIKELNRKLNKEEYEKIENYVYDLNIKNGYIQELGKHEEEYVPDFNLTF
jgi:putative pyruvate formate lyase activating enzyme